jgi:hypothetical protein
MYTQQELESRIRELDLEIAQAISSVSTDGTSTSVDLNAKREERDRLQKMQQSRRRKRPTTAGIYLRF